MTVNFAMANSFNSYIIYDNVRFRKKNNYCIIQSYIIKGNAKINRK